MRAICDIGRGVGLSCFHWTRCRPVVEDVSNDLGTLEEEYEASASLISYDDTYLNGGWPVVGDTGNVLGSQGCAFVSCKALASFMLFDDIWTRRWPL